MSADFWPLFLRSLLALLAVLALAIGAIYLLRRRAPALRAESEDLRILAHLPLGYSRSLLVISWRGRKILVGATAYSITPLAEEEDQRGEDSASG